jgi:glycosyltransferase involved in cell wall biosynthesis
MSAMRIDADGRPVGTRELTVIFAVPDFDPSVGGTTRQTRVQAEALARRGHRVAVVTRRLVREWPAHEVVDGLEVFRIGPPGRGRLADRRALVSLGRWLRRHRDELGILQVVMWPDAIVAAAAAGVLGRTVVLWAIRGEIAGSLAPPGVLRGTQARARRSLLSRVEHVTLTKTMATELSSVGLRAPDTVIPVPVDRNHFRPPTEAERSEAREGLGIARDAFTVVYVGHLEERKAVDRLITAMIEVCAAVPAARLLLVGGGRGARSDTESALREQVVRDGLEEVVSFCGVVPDPRSHLWAADVLALPSLREGLPNSLLEALACGVPCVAPGSAGGDEVLDERTGLVPASNSPHDLATALVALAGDERRDAMREAARARSELFDVESVADAYEELYARVASAVER